MLNYILGDLLDSDERIIAQGCNSHGVDGAGLALAIRNRYPECSKVYRKEYEQFGLPLGSAVIWHNWKNLLSDGKPSLIIANCITQKNMGSQKGKVYCDYDAIAESMKTTADYAKFLGYKSLGTVLIGAGLAQGDWKIIAPILRDISEEINIDINVYIIDSALYEKYKND
jgi:O-acetyl-ADP-ribose deacetylase (regulator of RNase III)